MSPTDQNDHYKALKTGQGQAQAAGHAGGMGKTWNTVKRPRQQGFIHYVKVATQPARPAMASLQGSKRAESQRVGDPQTRADVVAPSRNATSIPSPTRLVSANLRAVVMATLIGGEH